MATQLTREALNSEVNSRFWANTGYKIGKPLDPNIPADKAMTKVWLAVFDQVQKEARAGTLVMTHVQPDVIEALADAQVASDVAADRLKAAAAATDPETAKRLSTEAAASVQTAAAKAREARAGVPLNIAPDVLPSAVRDATASAPPPSAPAEDHIAHVQMQNKAAQSGPPPAQPPQDALYQEANKRFWAQYNYKPGQKLDMSDPQDQMMAQAWLLIFHDVEREAQAGTLAMGPPYGAPQDPYADVPPQGPSQQSQPQYGGYGAPPGLTPPQQPQYAPMQAPPQYAQDFSQPQYGGYGAPPGMTPPQYGGAQQGFPQTPQFGGPQEMAVPQYGASQQVASPQYDTSQDLSQYGMPQQPSSQDLSQYGMTQPSQAPQGYPPQPQVQPPSQPQVPRGMEGFPPDLAQYMQQEQAQRQATQQQAAPQAAPQQAPQRPQQDAPPSRGIRETADRATQGASQAVAQAASRARTALTPTPASSSDAWGTGAKIGVAVAAFGGLLAVVYAVSRGSRHASVLGSSPREVSRALLPSRGRY